jgi:hypothetical protein
MKKRLLIISLIFISLVIFTGPALAQTYAFSLDKETVDAYWENDGSLSLVYQFVFTNAGYADPIDYIDVGMPTNSYNLYNIQADIDGTPISHIAYSSYVDGIELGLGSNAIRPGTTGTVNVYITGIENVLYTDSSSDGYASAVFSPTWFDSDFVSGSTDLTVTYHLPTGVKPDEPRWHRSPSGFPDTPVTGIDKDGRVVYVWQNTNANGYTQYLFGASFPSNYVPATAITTPTIWQRLGIDPGALIGFSIFCLVFLFIFGIPILTVISARNRRMKYLPPKIAIAGQGIKRGLTSIEAAILLEQPMDKILTMILFAVIKKGAASVVTRDPLKLDVVSPFPEGLRDYEINFLNAMKISEKNKRAKDMQACIVNLIKGVQTKMKGFSAKETRDYYEEITKKAWAQVEQADTPEVRSEKYEEVMEWTMLDKDYDDRMKNVFRNYPVFLPTWWNRYDPTYSTPISTMGAAPTKTSAPASRPTPGGAGLPHLPGSDFAASVVTGVQTFAASAVGNITGFTSGVTQRTNPVPVSTSSGSFHSSGGGSSCACACACAGCACACAGGGR